MAKVKITQVKSISGQTARQRKTIEALGLKKMHQTIEKELTAQVKGMLDKVNHLVIVENA